jgi:hypothetical protein
MRNSHSHVIERRLNDRRVYLPELKKRETADDQLGREGVEADFIVRKVAGSIPDEVIFLNLPNLSGRTRPWGLLSL